VYNMLTSSIKILIIEMVNKPYYNVTTFRVEKHKYKIRRYEE